MRAVVTTPENTQVIVPAIPALGAVAAHENSSTVPAHHNYAKVQSTPKDDCCEDE